MSHNKDEEEKEEIDCLLDQCNILLETLKGIHGSFTRVEIIQQLEEVKKRVDYMLLDLKGEY